MDFFHVGVVVADIDQSMDELGAALGCSWGNRLGPREVGPWTLTSAFSVGTTPLLELLQGSPGSPWYVESGSRLHHLGYWSADPEKESERLSEAGLPIVFNGPGELGLSSFYHLAETAGVRLELLNLSYREGMEEANSIQLPAPSQSGAAAT
jgi:hypothetical protein